ncbi:MAG: hypothetical protein M3406_08250, partial [Chloroflexota bacterium]|nr:hypothetical protein [Chloroflexota bacterium]
MAAGEHRPLDEEYWESPWSTVLFAGDLFEAIPFGDQPTVLYSPDDADPPDKHYLGDIVFGYGLLITPTCDMVDQHDAALISHPFRVLVPVVPLAEVVRQTGAVAESEKLLRSRDTVRPYMYLPTLPGMFEEEQVACLFRPTLVSDELLADPPRRIAQLRPDARRHLKVKLAAYWARVAIDRNDLPLREKLEDEVRSAATPPSR